MRLYILIPLILFTACNISDSRKVTEDRDSTAGEVNDSPIISERTDGPANIRDTVNGKLLFSIYDNIPVSATDTENKWLQVGVFADLTQGQKDSLVIHRGSKLYVDGNEIGLAIEDVPLQAAFRANNGWKGELVGFTAISNIKESTVPENIFAKMANGGVLPLTLKDFRVFFKDFDFNEYSGLLPQFKGYEIDENWIDDPSPMLRLWLIFDGVKLYGVFHSRPIQLHGVKTIKTQRGFYFSAFSENQKTNKELIDAFNNFVGQVD